MEIVAEGLAFPEGPVVMADGSVIVVEIVAGRITRCCNGRKETLCEIGGADMQDAWLTYSARGLPVKVRWDEPGLRLN